MTSFLLNLTAAALLLSQEGTSGPVSVRVEASPPELTVADSLRLRFLLSIPRLSLEESLASGQQLAYTPEPLTSEISRLEGFRLVAELPPEQSMDQNEVHLVWTYVLEPRRTGPATLPGFHFVFVPHAPDQESIRLATEPITIVVKSLVGLDPLKAAPRPPAALPESGTPRLWFWLAALLAMAGGRWFLYRRNRGPSPVPEPTAPSTPREVALMRLNAESTPSAWHCILLDYLNGSGTSHTEPGIAILLRDLDAAQFAPEERMEPEELRSRLRQFFQPTNL